MKRTWKKVMQMTNVNKRFSTFSTMIKHEKHIDSRAKISENSDEFLRSLVKSLKKVLTSHGKVLENAIIQNEKPQKAEK